MQINTCTHAYTYKIIHHKTLDSIAFYSFKIIYIYKDTQNDYNWIQYFFLTGFVADLSCVKNNSLDTNSPMNALTAKTTDAKQTYVECQSLCYGTTDCKWFVWEEDDTSCWLFTQQRSEKKKFYGPERCPGISLRYTC